MYKNLTKIIETSKWNEEQNGTENRAPDKQMS